MRSPKYWKNFRLKKSYGITIEQFDEMLERQKGLCPICKIRPATHLDHDHSTGRVRNILCHKCNVALSFLNEDPDIALRAAEYIKFWRI